MTAGARPQVHLQPLLDALIVFAACEAVAAAIWLWPATVRIVNWPASGPVRMALVATQGRLLWLAAASLVIAALALAWSRRRGGVRALAPRVLPLCLLWLWAVPYLPWLPDRLPLLLVFDGPVRWIVLAVALAGVMRATVAERLQLIVRWRVPTRATVFAVSLGAYLAFGSMSARALGPGGDEPHYLMIAHSLLADWDLQIENNHLAGDYRSFFNAELRPDYLTRGQNGAIYSIHAPGLPALLLPAYALAGYAGALVFLCLLAALTALAVFDLAGAVAGRRAAIITWIAVCFSVPFIPHAWLLFPEMPGALLVAWGALWFWQPVLGHGQQAPGLRWFWRGAVIGLLPWLHTKFIVFLAIFMTGLLLRLREHRRLAVTFLLPIAASIAVWLLSFYLIYGTISPEAPYGDYTRLYVVNENIPRGFLGLLFDQKFGLFFYAPVYLFALAGGWYLVRQSQARYFAALLILITAAFVGSTTRLYMWWGGSSAPARFLVPVLPCLAPLVAVALQRAQGAFGRGLLAIWIAIGLGAALIGSLWPSELYLFSDPHGRGRLVETIQAGAPLAETFPTFTNEDWLTPLGALIPWLAAAGVALLAMAGMARARRETFAVATTGCLTFLIGAAVLTARPDPSVREATAGRGRLDLVWAYDSPRHHPFSLRSRRVVPTGEFYGATQVSIRTLPAGPLPLPPGRYEARVWFAGSRPRRGEVVVSASPTLVFARTDGLLANPAVLPFRLPVESGRVSISVSDETVAASVSHVEVAPVDVVPAAARPEMPIRAVESIPTWPDGYLVYTDEHAYPEGGVFWTRGTAPTTVMVAPAGASRLTLTLHLGPLSGRVAIAVAGRDYSTTVGPNAVTVVEAALPAGVDLVPVTIASPGFFRPHDVDPASSDTRGLGCQVRVELG